MASNATDLPDLRQLHYFASVVKYGGFRRASFHLGISQPVLSKKVQELEDSLGRVLLQRGAKGVYPTEAGTALVQEVDTLIRQAKNVYGILAKDQQVPRGRVSIAIPPSVSSVLVTPLSKAVSELYPEIFLFLQESSILSVIDKVETGQVDLGIASSPTLRNSLVEEYIVSQEIVISGRHFPFDDEFTTIDFLRNAPLVMRPPPHGIRAAVEQLSQRIGIRLVPAIEVDGTYMTVSLLLNAEYYSIAPVTVLHEYIADGRLDYRRIAPLTYRHLTLVSQREKPLSHAARIVSQLIVSILRDLRLEILPERAFPQTTC